ncbi:MAG: L,D-transpeptidase family protein [Methylophilaceae bacterium]
MKQRLILVLLTALLMPWSATAVYRAERPSGLAAFIKNTPRDIENLLVQSLLEITQGKLDEALNNIDHVISAVPNFKLAYLVRGDLLQAKAHQVLSFGAAANAPSDEIADLKKEAQVRLEHYLAQTPEQPDVVWQLDSTQKNAIVVDTVKSRLYLYRNDHGKPTYVADYYVTVGKNGTVKQKEGDKKTPLGVYFSGIQLDKEKLPDLYGIAAYPLNYPNELDKKQGKSGHGIWLHGTPKETFSRPPYASDGCVVLANVDIESLAPILKNGNTPIVIFAEKEASVSATQQRESLLKAIEQWRSDWQSKQTETYLSHYAQDFFSEDANSNPMNFEAWAAHKRRVQQDKAAIRVNLSDISVFRYPNSPKPMVVVNFNQDYQANQLNNKMRKRQYWTLEQGRWKILYEGAA